jgi:glycosyltransferase involved in cell wall biosynthesis
VGLAIEAVAAAPEVGTLLVAGEGPQRPGLEALAQRIAPGRVRFLGSVADPRAAYAASDVVVLSSRTEGLPAVLIEAGLAGLPVIATDVGYVRDIVIDGETGFLVPPDDAEAMSAALQRAPSLRNSARAPARSHCIEHFDLDTVVADAWAAVLRRVLA